MAASLARHANDIVVDTIIQPDTISRATLVAPAVERVIRTLQSDIPVEERSDLAPLVNWGGAAGAPIHRWMRYREAYSARLIDELKLGRTILDPFCGCGSVLLGAAKTNRSSLGIDVNPLAVFATRVKTTPLQHNQIKKAEDFACSVHEVFQTQAPGAMPCLSIADKVFEPDILDSILRLRRAIEDTASNDPALHDFLLLAWLAILEEVGSYFKEGNGIKYRNKKRLKNGYIRRDEGIWQNERFGSDQKAFVLERFTKQLKMMIDDTACWESGTWTEQEVIEGNALEATKLVGDVRYESILFSPPYANRFDYFESLKVELWFGGFVHSYDELNTLRKRSLRSHLGADLNRPVVLLEPLEQLIGMMDPNASSWRMRVPSALRGYFDDMRTILRQCRILAPQGTCSIVVGNSAFAGVIIPTDILIAKLGLEVGFKKAKLLAVRHLTVAPQQRTLLQGLEPYMRESVVTLE